MKERRWPWYLAGSLLIVSGTIAVWSVYLSWLVCSDTVISQGPLGALIGRPSAEISYACILVLADAESMPAEPSLVRPLAAMATGLAGLAWLVLVAGINWTDRQRVAILPLAVLVLMKMGLLLAPIDAYGSVGRADSVFAGMAFAVDLAAFVALCTVLVSAEANRRLLLLGVLAIWGVSYSGLLMRMADWLVMFIWSGRYWEDNPPGSGYLTAVIPFIAGLTIMIIVRRVQVRSGRPPESDAATVEAVTTDAG